MVSKINPRIHRQHRKRPRQDYEKKSGFPMSNPGLFPEGKQGQISSEEEHVLRVAGRPPVRVARLQEGARIRSRLLYRRLDKLVEELRDQEAKSEAEPLDLAPKEEVRDETAERDKDGNERDPCEEEPQRVAALVPNVGQGYGFHRRRHRRRQLFEIYRRHSFFVFQIGSDGEMMKLYRENGGRNGAWCVVRGAMCGMNESNDFFSPKTFSPHLLCW